MKAYHQIDVSQPLAPYDPGANVHTGDPDTSKEAAQSVTATVTENQWRVYDLFLGLPNGGPDFEILRLWLRRFGKVPESTPRKRRHDLVAAGIIVRTLRKTINPNNRRVSIWKLRRLCQEDEIDQAYHRVLAAKIAAGKSKGFPVDPGLLHDDRQR